MGTVMLALEPSSRAEYTVSEEFPIGRVLKSMDSGKLPAAFIIEVAIAKLISVMLLTYKRNFSNYQFCM